MDELGERLSSILSNPESVEQLRRAAEELFGKTEGETAKPSPQDLNIPSELGDIGSIASVIAAFKKTAPDSRAALITALKPYLSSKRQERADRAIKILRVLDMLPLLQESGLLEKLI